MLFRVFLFVFVIGAFAASPAHAGEFVWKDTLSGASLSYPDTWERVNNLNPRDVLVINAPSNADGSDDYASCRLQIHEDRRFAIYPVQYSGAIQRQHFSGAFWDAFTRIHSDVSITEFRNNAGLGRGAASMADYSFNAIIGPDVRKRGMGFVSLYNNHVYVFECSAEEIAFAFWVPAFRKILSSVDFKKTVYENPHGLYRNFLNDRPLVVHAYPDYTL